MKRLAAVADASANVLACRDEGHQWLFADDHVVERRGEVTEFIQERTCSRCSTSRRRTIEVPSMAVVRTTYAYPDDYLVAAGVRSSGALVRRTILDRILADRARR